MSYFHSTFKGDAGGAAEENAVPGRVHLYLQCAACVAVAHLATDDDAYHGSGTDAGYAYHPAYGAYRNQENSHDGALESDLSEEPSPEENGALSSPLDSDTIVEPEGEFIFKDGIDW